MPNPAGGKGGKGVKGGLDGLFAPPPPPGPPPGGVHPAQYALPGSGLQDYGNGTPPFFSLLFQRTKRSGSK
jgi:hypothetical protein